MDPGSWKLEAEGDSNTEDSHDEYAVHDCMREECLSCGKKLGLNDEDGFDYCFQDACQQDYDATLDWDNLPSSVRSCFSYSLDAGSGKAGTVWEGLPTDPEPYCGWDDVPIFKEHPGLENYRGMPCSAFLEQVRLAKLAKQLNEGARTSAISGIEYSCFLCKQKHVALYPVTTSTGPCPACR